MVINIYPRHDMSFYQAIYLSLLLVKSKDQNKSKKSVPPNMIAISSRGKKVMLEDLFWSTYLCFGPLKDALLGMFLQLGWGQSDNMFVWKMCFFQLSLALFLSMKNILRCIPLPSPFPLRESWRSCICHSRENSTKWKWMYIWQIGLAQFLIFINIVHFVPITNCMPHGNPNFGVWLSLCVSGDTVFCFFGLHVN